jgi:hypothetical protein
MMEAVSHQNSAVSKPGQDGREGYLSKKKLKADGRKLTAKRGETT